MQKLRQPDRDEALAAPALLGREHDLVQLTSRVRGGGLTLVHGPPGVGKSTLARASIIGLREEGWASVELALAELGSRSELEQALAAQTLRLLPGLEDVRRLDELRDRVGRDRAAALLRAERVLGSRVLDVALGHERVGGGETYMRDLTRALAPGLLSPVAERQIVLFVDDVQELAGGRGRFGDGSALLWQLRAVAQHSPSLSLLFAGRAGVTGVLAEDDQAFFGFGTTMEVERLSQRTWADAIGERLRLEGFAITPSALDLLIDRADRMPWPLTLMLRRLTSATRDTDQPIVAEDVARVWDQLRDEQRPFVDQQVARVRDATRLGLTIARDVARGKGPYASSHAQSAQVARALRALQGIGALDQEEPRKWRVADPFLAARLREDTWALPADDLPALR